MWYGGDLRLCVRARGAPTNFLNAFSSAVCPPAPKEKELAVIIACASDVAPPVELARVEQERVLPRRDSPSQNEENRHRGSHRAAYF